MVLQIYQRRHKNNNTTKRRRNNDQEFATISDPISNLPEDVIKIIFSCLPIQDAVRSSILSKIWRYRWAKLVSQVILEGPRDESMRKTFIYNAQSMVDLISCQLMLHHEGPIKKFTLTDPRLGPCPEIDNLIFFLLRNGLEDLTLHLDRYKVPLSLFKYQQLRELNLTRCILEHAPTFKGFSRLSTLRLDDVFISNQVLNGLISGSPLLKLLDLKFPNPSKDFEIEIDAPNLKSFSFGGFANSLIFKNVPLLAQVSIVDFTIMRKKREGYLVEFFHDLPALQDLSLISSFFEFLTASEVPTRLPNASLRLKALTLNFVVLNNLHYLSLIFCLIRSSPNLNYIKIKFLNVNCPIIPNEVMEYLKEQENEVIEVLKEQKKSGLILNQLERVTLNDVIEGNSQLELIQLLLAISPNLKYMTIYNYSSQTQALNIMKQVTKFQRATNEGRVLFRYMNTNQAFTIGGFRGLARTKNELSYIEFDI